MSTVRKVRIHPYTRELNNIKASIHYYKKMLESEIEEYKIKKYQDKIDELEYKRYIYKLGPKQIDAIQKYCQHKGIECDIPQVSSTERLSISSRDDSN